MDERSVPSTTGKVRMRLLSAIPINPDIAIDPHVNKTSWWKPMNMSDTIMLISGMKTPQRLGNAAPANNATAPIAVKFAGCGKKRVKTPNTINATTTKASLVCEENCFILIIDAFDGQESFIERMPQRSHLSYQICQCKYFRVFRVASQDDVGFPRFHALFPLA